MRDFKIAPAGGLLLATSILVASFIFHSSGASIGPTDGQATAPFIQRGRIVEKHFLEYHRSLDRYLAALSAVLRTRAPDLLAGAEPSEPTRTGYQVLPHIVANATVDEQRGLGITAYSWPWTDRLIDEQERNIVNAEMALRRAAAASAQRSRLVLQALARASRRLEDQHKLIEAHVQYNRFWQAEIATDLTRFDRETHLQRLVLQRQSIAASLAALESGFKEYPSSLNGGDRAHRMPGMAKILKECEALLASRLDPIFGPVDPPAFITVNHGARSSVIRVPIWTDIEDRDYVGKLQRAIETIWRVNNARWEFRVELQFRFISTEDLYDADIVHPTPFDLARHLGLFPVGGAVLTTGAITTHVRGRAIVLGPHDLTGRVLAHEFGHVLGFRDGYIRGYQDLGASGFRIMETITDPTDLMASPTTGQVHAGHFEKLLDRIRPIVPIGNDSRRNPKI